MAQHLTTVVQEIATAETATLMRVVSVLMGAVDRTLRGTRSVRGVRLVLVVALRGIVVILRIIVGLVIVIVVLVSESVGKEIPYGLLSRQRASEY